MKYKFLYLNDNNPYLYIILIQIQRLKCPLHLIESDTSNICATLAHTYTIIFCTHFIQFTTFKLNCSTNSSVHLPFDVGSDMHVSHFNPLFLVYLMHANNDDSYSLANLVIIAMNLL